MEVVNKVNCDKMNLILDLVLLLVCYEYIKVGI